MPATKNSLPLFPAQQPLPRLLSISDSRLTPNIEYTLKTCIDMGAPWIGIREYTMQEKHIFSLVYTLVKYAENCQTQISIWNNTEMAKTFSIGLHLSLKHWDQFRKNTVSHGYSFYPLGVSTHTYNDICYMEKGKQRYDYITLSPLYNSISKDGYKGMGQEKFTHLCKKSSKPVYALGGIKSATAKQSLKSGAYGIAICGEAMRNPQNIKIFLEKYIKF